MPLDPEGDARKAVLIAQLACTARNSCASDMRENLLIDTHIEGDRRWFAATCASCGKSVDDKATISTT